MKVYHSAVVVCAMSTRAEYSHLKIMDLTIPIVSDPTAIASFYGPCLKAAEPALGFSSRDEVTGIQYLDACTTFFVNASPESLIRSGKDAGMAYKCSPLQDVISTWSSESGVFRADNYLVCPSEPAPLIGDCILPSATLVISSSMHSSPSAISRADWISVPSCQ